MPNLKEYITASYGASIYNQTNKLKEAKKEVAKTKNQFIFLQRCVKHKVVPKSLRIKAPKRSLRVKTVIDRCRYELVISVKNDAKYRFFKCLKTAHDIEDNLKNTLTVNDMVTIQGVTEKARETMHIRSKERLVNKFNSLIKDKPSENKEKNTNYVKDAVLNLVSDNIPDAHKDLLNLGPKFVPNVKEIPVMDIVTATESSALKLEYSKKIIEEQNLRKHVLRVLKTAKPVKDNLTREQRSTLKEIKNDQNICIYPFDKGFGYEDARKKIEE